MGVYRINIEKRCILLEFIFYVLRSSSIFLTNSRIWVQKVTLILNEIVIKRTRIKTKIGLKIQMVNLKFLT